MPATVRNAIARHLGALSSDAQETLTVAALFGREFRLDVVARAIGGAVATVLRHVDEATTARVVVAKPAEPGRYRFVHALFAETLSEALGEARRVALHRQAASALASDAHAEALVPEIAHHWFAAGPGGDPASAVEWAQRAAERAFAMLAYEEAAEWYRSALEAHTWQIGADRGRRAELLLGAGEARKRAGHTGAAKAAFDEAAAVGRAIRSAEILTRAALGRAPAVMYAEQAPPDPVVTAVLEEAIAAWQGHDSALHACALARLGVTQLFGDQPRRLACETEALAMARRLRDPEALRNVLAAWFSSNHARHDVPERYELVTELARLAEEARDFEVLAGARLRRVGYLIERGDVATADAELVAFARLADDLRTPVWQWYAGVMHGMRRLLGGRFAEAETTIREALALGSAALPYAAPAYFTGQMLLLSLLRGVEVEQVDAYRAVFQHHPDEAALSPLVWANCELGRFDQARQVFEHLAADDFEVLGKDVVPVLTATLLAEGCAMLADEGRAVLLYDRLCPHAGSWVAWAEGACLGPVTHALGLLARTMGRLDEGAAHFEAAIADTRRTGARPYLARSLYEYAVLLQRRGGSDDGARACALLDEAHVLADDMGMAALAAKIARLTPALEGAAQAAMRAPGAGATIFRREGDYWVIAYAGATVRMRDARGIGYLATLLYHPGREFHAAELVAGDGDGRQPVAMVVEPATGVRVRRALDDGAGLSPDAQARVGYARRLREVEAELAEAEQHHDVGHVERLRVEQEMLHAEIIGTMRVRRTGTHAERARLTVTKGIGSALTRIASAHPDLGAHLTATVKRGYFCVYVPDPRHAIDWER
jgi:tetratricopeptide (TPR) repeat protein